MARLAAHNRTSRDEPYHFAGRREELAPHRPVRFAAARDQRIGSVAGQSPGIDRGRAARLEAGGRTLGGDIPKPAAAALARMSHGFPQHVHGYIEGACLAYDQHGGLDSRTAINEAADYGHRFRRDHYQSRLAAMGAANRSAMLSIAATMINKGVDHLDWDEAVAAAAAKRPNPESIVEAAVERGVLAEAEDGTVGFGIPSFFAYMHEQIGERDNRATSRPLPS